jgi:transcriptional regulator with XRE-family HTH domain
MADFLDKWVNENEDHARLVTEETLILEVIEEIWRVLQAQGKNKADLARALNTSTGHLTQMLKGSRNMTLRTLADICFVLNMTPKFHLEVKETVTLSAEQLSRIDTLSQTYAPVHSATESTGLKRFLETATLIPETE